ncbi:hypothetical protein KL905_002467 [Ogataea polymorpha]|uniref:Uncharacterized protein n=1 Tax=Ogataea polymorpha TaxID=460523 RepID=A0A1B7SPP2_9ASCO|nr:uncharacterized protein OGAPODRAFT_11010 [Ogataea polymorpha]KAG7889290.1 hypothetical protein KL936_002864 [Ogataea polymorpha]KAG7894675.1 hypothetical protein KL908_002047 [Ogataea polymorpha]KAG7899731.1 hypothetical protein KL935_003272 [Ogataea polymorpha]KAG7906571.1 hypothetical protein KL907_002211 [Ogataea polymorpha]KAG7909818.1 hypothetical protein KL906_001723 [Ogataea polymorpha]
MPIELLLSPVMRPVVLAKSVLFHPHRRSSRYVPHIIDLDEDNCSEFAVRRRFGTGSKIFDVYDTKAEGSGPLGPTEASKRLFWFVRSRAVKGAYKMYNSEILGTGPNGEDEPCAALRAGLRSNILLIRAPDVPVTELGWHIINHRVDALDQYRMFTLADGATYQWTTEGKFLERVKNVGEKESEVRERIGQVIPAGASGFTVKVDESKIPKELALASALCSYVDHWNTNLAVGGIYYARKYSHVRWKRD